jgi:hypothetical protein
MIFLLCPKTVEGGKKRSVTPSLSPLSRRDKNKKRKKEKGGRKG